MVPWGERNIDTVNTIYIISSNNHFGQFDWQWYSDRSATTAGPAAGHGGLYTTNRTRSIFLHSNLKNVKNRKKTVESPIFNIKIWILTESCFINCLKDVRKTSAKLVQPISQNIWLSTGVSKNSNKMFLKTFR